MQRHVGREAVFSAFPIACRLTKNESVGKDSGITTQGNFQPSNEAQFVCPVTGQQLNGRFRFSVLRNTGHVISNRALKEVGISKPMLSAVTGKTNLLSQSNCKFCTSLLSLLEAALLHLQYNTGHLS